TPRITSGFSKPHHCLLGTGGSGTDRATSDLGVSLCVFYLQRLPRTSLCEPLHFCGRLIVGKLAARAIARAEKAYVRHEAARGYHPLRSRGRNVAAYGPCTAGRDAGHRISWPRIACRV